MTTVWAMASANTFNVPPIAGFVQGYLLKSKVSVDPFARNKRWATYTNDLNPNTGAQCHMEAADFMRELIAAGVRADLVIFDPPY
ncbi:MAG: adenine-specific DNA methylase, partial [Verrucomicrobiota bacterium]|nr:adenine-specific DNA methylase [Verrucomicrobiota bacterium]